MDPNNFMNTATDDCWDLEMSMDTGNHPFLDQVLANGGIPLPPTLPQMNLFHSMDQPQQATLLPPPSPLTTVTQLGALKEASLANISEVDGEEEEEEGERLTPTKEMMYKIHAMQSVDIDPNTLKKPKRRNVWISDAPQSIAARHRRERISERIRILRRLVPGGMKMDSASMLDEAIRYVKFLKRHVKELQSQGR